MIMTRQILVKAVVCTVHQTYPLRAGKSMLNGVAGVLQDLGRAAHFVLFAFQSVYKMQLCWRFGNQRLLFSKNLTVPVLNLKKTRSHEIKLSDSNYLNCYLFLLLLFLPEQSSFNITYSGCSLLTYDEAFVTGNRLLLLVISLKNGTVVWNPLD